MLFPVPPAHTTEYREKHFVRFQNSFNDDEISKIIGYGEKNLASAKLRSEEGENTDSFTHLRKASISWLPPNPDTAWLYQKLAIIASRANSTFEYDLRGFVDMLQYTVYDASGDHYTWHMDKGALGTSSRKLSIVVQLSEPNEYQGGDLQFMYASEPYTAIKEKGSVYTFPSFVMHKVTPVFSGVRRTLVAWVAGPAFK